MPSWLSLNFQDSGCFTMMEMSILHEYVMVVMMMVTIVIFYILFNILYSNYYYQNLSEGTLIETIWSILPAIMLIILVLPSMKVLYLMEDLKSSSLSIKVMAHQWYWSYISPLYLNMFLLKNKNMLTNMMKDSLTVTKTTIQSSPRLLNTTFDLVLPNNTISRLMISSMDVIHAFTIPSMGLKVDAMPGRINQLYINPICVGLYYGQCSEICGSNHSFMPISMQVCTPNNYKSINLLKSLQQIN